MNPDQQPAAEELSAADVADLKLLEEPAAQEHTILEVWSEMLNGIEDARKGSITPNMAADMVMTWPELKFALLDDYYELYHDYLVEAREIVREEIASDPEALQHTEDDDAANHDHYVNILRQWNMLVAVKETEWRASDEDAAIKYAAMGQLQNFLLSKERGIVNYLSSINLMMTEAERESLKEAVESVWIAAGFIKEGA